MRILLAVVLAACGSKPPAQDPIPTFDQDEDTQTTLPVPSDEHFELKGPLRSAMPDAMRGVPVHVMDSKLLLFGAEQLEASTMIAKAFRDAGYTVEEPKRTREIYERASRGQHVVTGQACGGSLDAGTTERRWATELGVKGRIETAVYCETRCWIEVNVTQGMGFPRGRTAFYTAPYDIGQPWRTELPKRLGELIAFRSLRDFGPGKLVPGAVEPSPAPDLAYADTNFMFELPASLVPPIKKCLGTSETSGLLVETDASDKVTKCEPYARASESARDAVPCMCTALVGKSLEGKGPRRAPIIAHGNGTGGKTTAGLDLSAQSIWDQVRDESTGLFAMKVSDPSIAGWDTPSWGALEACFTSMGEGFVAANVEVAFDQAGKATSVKITPTEGVMNLAQEKCTQAAFLQSKAPCPAVPTSIGYASMFARVTKP